ncbi:MAG TPA: hypothetical protein PKL78_01375 [Anaerolineales bacterium]|nr:hypothetical protein [Anaerolineales bacterium]
MINLLKKLKLPDQSLKFLALLLSADLFFVFFYMVSKIARFLDLGTTIRLETFNLTMDLGLSESFQYVKEFWIVILFIWLMYKNRNFLFTGWVFLYIYLLFDDMFGFHEGLAAFFIAKSGIEPEKILFNNVRYQDFGEIGISLLFGVILLSIIAFTYFKGNAVVRDIFHHLIGLLFLLVFFGVVADFIDRLFSPEAQKMMVMFTDVLEDGGEMIAMSLMCWYVSTLSEPAPS